MEVGAFSDIGAVAALVAISFFSFVGGLIFRKWPEKVQEYAENVDGLAFFISPDGHRALIQLCGLTLIVMSFAALLAVAWVV